jgi:hypothetical protein
MKLSAEAHAEVEAFFREHRGERELRLPPVSVYGGPVARVLMRAVGMSAITFGRHVFVRPNLIVRKAEGRATVPGWLLVHEAAHVLQYEEKGYLRFLGGYALGYLRALRAGKRWDAQGRMAAYMAIAEEREAREAERAYRESRQEFVIEIV